MQFVRSHICYGRIYTESLQIIESSWESQAGVQKEERRE
jgi:hypothetical protein